MRFTSSVQLSCGASDCHSITLRGLTGAEVPGAVLPLVGEAGVLARLCRSSLLVDSAASDGAGAGAWDANTSRLTLWVCPDTTIEAWEEIAFSVDVTNAPLTQPSIPSPEIVIDATGPVPFEEVNVSKPGVVFLGVPGGTDPLKIVAPKVACFLNP